MLIKNKYHGLHPAEYSLDSPTRYSMPSLHQAVGKLPARYSAPAHEGRSRPVNHGVLVLLLLPLLSLLYSRCWVPCLLLPLRLPSSRPFWTVFQYGPIARGFIGCKVVDPGYFKIIVSERGRLKRTYSSRQGYRAVRLGQAHTPQTSTFTRIEFSFYYETSIRLVPEGVWSIFLVHTGQ
jgi:hypothetical protein